MKKFKQACKKIKLVLILIFIIQTLPAQENYTKGYVVNIDNDTIHGLLDYKDWEKNPNKINFKQDAQDETVVFKPTDIIEFSVGNEIYVSGIANTEISAMKTSNLDNNPRLKIKTDTIFLQALLKGEKSLFYYKDSDGHKNFYIQKDDGFELLVYKRYLKQEDGRQVISENKKYLGQLTLYLNECPTINSKLKITSYNQKSLIKLFRNYYECTQSKIIFKKEKEKINIEFGVLSGISITSLTFGSGVFNYLVDAEYNSSINFSPSLFCELIFPKNQRKWSLYNELLFTSYKVQGKYEDFENENHYTIVSTEIGYSYLKLNNLLRFKYPIGNVYWFVNGGISNGLALSETNYKKEELKFHTTERNNESLAIDEPRYYERALIFGTGAKYKRFSFEYRYEIGDGMSKYVTLNSLVKRNYFLIGYKF